MVLILLLCFGSDHWLPKGLAEDNGFDDWVRLLIKVLKNLITWRFWKTTQCYLGLGPRALADTCFLLPGTFRPRFYCHSYQHQSLGSDQWHLRYLSGIVKQIIVNSDEMTSNTYTLNTKSADYGSVFWNWSV